MLPQLDVSHFISQLFWLVLLFSLLYLLIKNVIIVNIESVLDKRSHELNIILLEVEKNNNQAKKILEQVLELEKEAQLKSFELKKETIRKAQRENFAKLNEISINLSKEYQKTEKIYKEELNSIIKKIPAISDEIADMLLDKLSNDRSQKLGDL